MSKNRLTAYSAQRTASCSNPPASRDLRSFPAGPGARSRFSPGVIRPASSSTIGLSWRSSASANSRNRNAGHRGQNGSSSGSRNSHWVWSTALMPSSRSRTYRVVSFSSPLGSGWTCRWRRTSIIRSKPASMARSRAPAQVDCSRGVSVSSGAAPRGPIVQ